MVFVSGIVLETEVTESQGVRTFKFTIMFVVWSVFKNQTEEEQ